MSKKKEKKGGKRKVVDQKNKKKLAPKRQKIPNKKHIKRKDSPSFKILKTVLQVLLYVFMISIIIVSLIFSLSGESNKSIFGYRFYTVLTNSMVPDKEHPKKNSFYAQDVIFVKDDSYENLKKDDVVTYSIGDGKAVLTHRLLDKVDHIGDTKGDFMITKGDANPTNDPPIEAEKLIGKVIFVVPKVGIVITFVRNNMWLCLIFAISLFGSIYVLKNYYL